MISDRKMFDKTNFFIATFGIFTECEVPNRAPDFVSNSGSKYWHTENDTVLVRQSNHWTHKVLKCSWILREGYHDVGKVITAKIRFDELQSTNCEDNRRSKRLRKERKRLEREMKLAA